MEMARYGDEAEPSLSSIGRTHAPVGAEDELQPAGPREYTDQGCCANCVISSVLAVILCRKRCDAGRVIAEFAFFPPDPPTYAVEEKAARISFNYRELDADPQYARFRRCDGGGGRPTLKMLTTARKQKIPVFYFRSDRVSAPCVIYLHANATDCGAMLPTYAAFSRRLGVHVLAGEYCGYGAATGAPTDRNVEADARAVYDEALRLGFTPDQIVLYGQSVGSGPACYLAARAEVRGVILHSPVASGIRALTGGGCCSPVHVYACLDPFNNLREVAKIDAPVFILHGTADEEIPWKHGEMLRDACKRPYAPYWVDGAGHNNLVEAAGDAYFVRLREFLLALEAAGPPEA
mmetsp:Transcript_1045/g.3109  ORF Transcript_1045/g.3109 Transcript_1045/m.3109 type:complete len:349 (+) Transcript_1045:236-1282(+)